MCPRSTALPPYSVHSTTDYAFYAGACHHARASCNARFADVSRNERSRSAIGKDRVFRSALSNRALDKKPSYTFNASTQVNFSKATEGVESYRSHFGAQYRRVYHQGEVWDTQFWKWLSRRAKQLQALGADVYHRNYYHEWWEHGFSAASTTRGARHECRSLVCLSHGKLALRGSSFLRQRLFPGLFWRRAEEQPVYPFPYAGVYFPSDILLALAVDASGLDAPGQLRFRTALLALTDQIKQNMDAALTAPFPLSAGDIVITHYENLQNRRYVVEGFVEHQAIKFGFRGVLTSKIRRMVPKPFSPRDNLPRPQVFRR